MGIVTYFFDTYAFYEIIKGNPDYNKYKTNVSIITTRLNLMELHYGLLSLYGAQFADDYYDKLLKLIVEIADETIKDSNYFGLQNRKKRLSYVDCIGYTLAKKYNVRFLTGDKQFEEFENVEFVK